MNSADITNSRGMVLGDDWVRLLVKSTLIKQGAEKTVEELPVSYLKAMFADEIRFGCEAENILANISKLIQHVSSGEQGYKDLISNDHKRKQMSDPELIMAKKSLHHVKQKNGDYGLGALQVPEITREIQSELMILTKTHSNADIPDYAGRFDVSQIFGTMFEALAYRHLIGTYAGSSTSIFDWNAYDIITKDYVTMFGLMHPDDKPFKTK